MTTRRGLFVAPFDALADPRVVGDLAAAAERAGWEGFFVWDHVQYGERVTAIADVWTCCAAVALRTERLLLGPMVTPLARRRPHVLAQQAASLAVLSRGRFVLGLGLGDDGAGEFDAFGDETDPRVRPGCSTRAWRSCARAGRGRRRPRRGERRTRRPLREAPEVPVWLAGRSATGAGAAGRPARRVLVMASTGPTTSSR